MSVRAGAILLSAAVLAGADLALKSTLSTPSLLMHERAPAWTVLSGVLFFACVLAARIDSMPLAVAAGLTAGGVVGNGISWFLHDGRVPDPLFLHIGGGVAFNLADVFVIAGLTGLIAALIGHHVRQRRRGTKDDVVWAR